MIRATVVISLVYAPDADMQEALEDKEDFETEFRRYFSTSLADMQDIHIDHTIVEVTEKP